MSGVTATKVARMPTSGPTHGRATGDGDDQGSHRRHCEGQAAGEEGVIARGRRMSTRGHCNYVDRGRNRGSEKR